MWLEESPKRVKFNVPSEDFSYELRVDLPILCLLDIQLYSKQNIERGGDFAREEAEFNKASFDAANEAVAY